MRQVHGRMDQAWEDVHSGWENLETRLIESGVLKLDSEEGYIVCLNVGGMILSVRRSILTGRTFSSILEVSWNDGRVPRDAEGFILLDESPVCVKYLIGVAMEEAGEERARVALPAEETHRLDYVSRALGLLPCDNPSLLERRVGDRPSTVGTAFTDTSSILCHGELGQFMTTLGTECWCPGEFRGMNLIYRASRDGMDAESFHSRCGDDSPSTIT
ncbi:unnamed protein product [Hapterophycus canaliculatus]